MSALHIKHVSKRFDNPKVHALEDISLLVDQNEIVSILGPSGCGKSTLLECIAGLLTPDRGEIVLDKKSIVDKRGMVSYMMQQDVLFPWRNVLENITLPLELSNIPITDAHKEALTYLADFGLDKFAYASPDVLSGGMKQRVALLRTYLCKKKVLLLDEPFGKLDVLTRMQIEEWFIHIWDHHKKTVVFVTHDIDEAIYLSDRVYLFSPSPGRVIAQLPIPLRRPRKLSSETNNQFLQIKKEIMHIFGLK